MPTITSGTLAAGPYATISNCRGCGAGRLSLTTSHYRLCVLCGYCTYCGLCPHIDCQECGKTHASSRICGSCHKCKSFCRCRNMPKALRDLPKVTAPVAHGKSVALVNRLTRPIGLELELAQWGSLPPRSPSPLVGYDSVHDGSVQPSGKELVCQPMAADGFLRGAIQLGGLLLSHGATVNNTCGFHVHVNAQDMDYWALRRILLQWQRWERAINEALVPAPRRNIRYCAYMKPEKATALARLTMATNQSDLKTALAMFNYDVQPVRLKDHLKQHRNNKYHESRYTGLNLHTWYVRGTLEWRLFPGTVNVNDLICWPLMCAYWVETVQNISDKEAASYATFEEFAQANMPDFLLDWYREVKEAVHQGEPGLIRLNSKSNVQWNHDQARNSRPPVEAREAEESVEDQPVRRSTIFEDLAPAYDSVDELDEESSEEDND